MSYPTNTIIVGAYAGSFPTENSPKYRCCCGRNTIASGATIVGVFEIIFCVLGAIGAFISYYVEFTIGYGSFVTTLVLVSLQLVLSSIMLYGISKENQWLVLPELIYCGIFTIVLAIDTAFLVITAFLAGFVVLGLLFLIILGLALCLYIWFFTVILHCYQYFTAKNHWAQHHRLPPGIVTSAPVYSMPVPYQYGSQPNVGYAQPPGYSEAVIMQPANASYPQDKFEK